MSDRLLYLVVEDLEVLPLQPGNGTVVGVADGNWDKHQIGVYAKSALSRGRRGLWVASARFNRNLSIGGQPHRRRQHRRSWHHSPAPHSPVRKHCTATRSGPAVRFVLEPGLRISRELGGSAGAA